MGYNDFAIGIPNFQYRFYECDRSLGYLKKKQTLIFNIYSTLEQTK